MKYLSLMRLTTLLLAISILAACGSMPLVAKQPRQPEILTIYPDGSMKLMDRPIPREDVIIYPDGYGGEKAAVVVRIELHPNFYRDSIVVRRVTDEVASTD